MVESNNFLGIKKSFVGGRSRIEGLLPRRHPCEPGIREYTVTYAGSAKNITKEFKKELKLEKRVGSQGVYSPKFNLKGFKVLLSKGTKGYDFTMILKSLLKHGDIQVMNYIGRYFIEPKYERV